MHELKRVLERQILRTRGRRPRRATALGVDRAASTVQQRTSTRSHARFEESTRWHSSAFPDRRVPRTRRLASYLPKYVRQSLRDCEDESRGVSRTFTTSSASLRSSGRSEGGSLQSNRARTFSCTVHFTRASSSVRRCRSRTCSSSVWNASSSTATGCEHYLRPSGVQTSLSRKTRRAVASLGGTSRTGARRRTSTLTHSSRVRQPGLCCTPN